MFNVVHQYSDCIKESISMFILLLVIYIMSNTKIYFSNRTFYNIIVISFENTSYI